MIRELDALEFLSMIALAEYKSGKMEFRISIKDLLNHIYAIEKSCPDIRIQFSHGAISSFDSHSSIMVLKNDEIYINTIEDIPMLKWYEPEEELQELCLPIIQNQNK